MSYELSKPKENYSNHLPNLNSWDTITNTLHTLTNLQLRPLLQARVLAHVEITSEQ